MLSGGLSHAHDIVVLRLVPCWSFVPTLALAVGARCPQRPYVRHLGSEYCYVLADYVQGSNVLVGPCFVLALAQLEISFVVFVAAYLLLLALVAAVSVDCEPN